MANEVLTKEEAEAVAELREYVIGDALIFTKSGPILALIDRLAAKVLAGDELAEVAKNGMCRLDVDYEDPISQCCAQELRTALAAYRSVK